MHVRCADGNFVHPSLGKGFAPYGKAFQKRLNTEGEEYAGKGTGQLPRATSNACSSITTIYARVTGSKCSDFAVAEVLKSSSAVRG